MSDNLLYGLAGLLFFQAYATIRLVRSKTFSREQKLRQLLFVWLVPFFGAAVTIAVLASDKGG
jgi:tellurite resistance protein TehA-like permease